LTLALLIDHIKAIPFDHRRPICDCLWPWKVRHVCHGS